MVNKGIETEPRRLEEVDLDTGRRSWED